jgi:glycerol-3-phosphate dehydrogenase (NAD(P)+)
VKIAVIGDGGWGTTLSILLAQKGNEVYLWGAFADYVDYLNNHRENIKFLPEIKIPQSIYITSDMKTALDGTEIAVLAVPSQHARAVAKKMKPFLSSSTLLVSASKGIEIDSKKRMSEVLNEVLDTENLAVLSGPSIAIEVANGIPTTVVSASLGDMSAAKKVQEVFITDKFRVYTGDDPVGIELGGSLKNVIAIAAGINDGLGLGSNSKSALMIRGITEISRLGAAMGAVTNTFWGLSGIGDLITTCISQYGRNRWFGEEIGRGKKPKEALAETEMVVEGFATTKAAYQLSGEKKIEMPITEQMYEVLYNNKDPKLAVKDLMTREPKAES